MNTTNNPTTVQVQVAGETTNVHSIPLLNGINPFMNAYMDSGHTLHEDPAMAAAMVLSYYYDRTYTTTAQAKGDIVEVAAHLNSWVDSLAAAGLLHEKEMPK